MKRALVIGSSGAIGSKVAMALDRDGHHVTGHRWAHLSPMRKSCLADLTDEYQIQRMMESMEPEILVNCAGVKLNGMVKDAELENWEHCLAVNLTAVFLLTKYALPAMMRRGWGRIVHMSSLAGRLPVPGASAYAASKAGLEGFVRTAAAEVAKKGITINAVAPGYIDAGIGARLPDMAKAALLQRIPYGQPGEVEDIVQAVRYLIDAPYVTGQVLCVDGGMF